MSRPPPPLRLPSSAKLRRNGESRRQASATHRTSKTSQKLVVLPSAPQTKPLAAEEDELDYETDVGHGRAHKTEGEKMSKDQRERAGFKRLTAYCVAESLNAKLLASYLKREHNVFPRVFDEALYVVCSNGGRVSPTLMRTIDVSPSLVAWVRPFIQYSVFCPAQSGGPQEYHVPLV